jgi:hypothetical protein
MAIGRLLAAIKSFPESLKVIGFPKNKDVGGTWINPDPLMSIKGILIIFLHLMDM